MLLFIRLFCDKLSEVDDDDDDRFLLSLVLFLPSRDEDNISFTKAFCDDFLAEAVNIRDAKLEYCPEPTLSADARLLLLLLLLSLLLLLLFDC